MSIFRNSMLLSAEYRRGIAPVLAVALALAVPLAEAQQPVEGMTNLAPITVTSPVENEATVGYLTFPVGSNNRRSFWSRWKPAWQVKRGASTYRLNFDLHRAGGLWPWAMLLVFAWSSVYMNLWDTVYTWTTRAVMDYRPPWVLVVPEAKPLEQPPLNWRQAQSVAERLMTEQAGKHHFRPGRPIMLRYEAESAVYFYEAESSLDINDRPRRYGAQVIFDARTGELRHVLLPSGQYAGNTVSNWLYALHMGNVFGLPYRIFVCMLGLAIAMLSVTGVYVWWKKRNARRSSASRRIAASVVEN
jgi:uncharacterized iron-regulated membrane protein